MSKDNNQFKYDFAVPGLCTKCHTEIAEFSGSHPNGLPVIKKLKTNFRTARIKLDDGSGMTISLCKDCIDFQPEDMAEIMESEINGWDFQVDRCISHWTPEKKDKHMEVYSKRFATSRVDKPWGLEQEARITKPREAKLRGRAKKAFQGGKP